MMTLEQLNDRADAKLPSRPTMSWAEMAHAEGHRRKLPKSVRPDAGAHIRGIGKDERLKLIMTTLRKHGDMGAHDIAKIVGVSHNTVRDDMQIAIDRGEAYRNVVSRNKVLFGLTDKVSVTAA